MTGSKSVSACSAPALSLFWISLNELWRKGGVTVRDELGAAPLDDWLWEEGVINDWLIDAVMATIRLWDDIPEGGSATLDPEYAWFTMDPNKETVGKNRPGLPRCWIRHIRFGSDLILRRSTG